jgi:hypothetical protein
MKRALLAGGLPEGSSAWEALWARYSDEAHRWFARMSPLCRVIEDREPHEPAWADPHPDPNDAWLWNTARRAGADLVVTANLRDAPPADAAGTRRHEQVGYIHPRVLLLLLAVWRDIHVAGRAPNTIDAPIGSLVGIASAADLATVATELRAILARIADEQV